MFRLAWTTDIHLNFLPRGFGPSGFGQHLAEDYDFDALVVTGDISECDQLEEQFESFWVGMGRKPTYFVMGNHDYYNGSFREAEIVAKRLHKSGMTWLSAAQPVQLTHTACLVGQEGFYDGMAGHGRKSRLIMNDFVLISDFEPVSRGEMNHDPAVKFKVMRTKANKEAALAYDKLTAAASKFDLIYFATHYPPFEKACFHAGGLSDGDWSPYFTSVVMGKTLLRVAQENPTKRFVVLCGHTHSSGTYRPVLNLTVNVGASEYRNPRCHEVFDIA